MVDKTGTKNDRFTPDSQWAWGASERPVWSRQSGFSSLLRIENENRP